MLSIKTKAIKLFESQLKAYADDAFPSIARSTLNAYAFSTMKSVKNSLGNQFVLRNKFTERSIRFNKARGNNVDTMRSEVGSTQGYMTKQEEGGVVDKTGKHGVAIPTSYSAGESESAKPRRRVTRKSNRMSSIRLRQVSGSFKSKKQKAVATIKWAVKSGFKYVYLELDRSKGIFKIVGGKRRPKIKMVYSLDRPIVIIRKRPWLMPAVTRVMKRSDTIYARTLAFELRRRGLFQRL
jgi:hypothetical protein